MDQAAGLLAMHCMTRGRVPSDYAVMTIVPDGALGDLTKKATRLLDAGQTIKGQTGMKLTRRETEVLEGVLHSLANKEIAIKLNLSERTVKFHVSSLLAKFNVRGRMELMRETLRMRPGQLFAVAV